MKAGNGGEISVKMALNGESNPNKVMNIQAEPNEVYFVIQAFLDFRGFDFCNFQFNAVYDSILFSSPLVLLSNLNLCDICFQRFFLCVPTLIA